MDLEITAREFKMLASKEKLTASELDRAKALMVELKRLGMSNPEIVELTGGRWSESTVKGYTKGIRATDPEPWKSTTSLFSQMLSRNFGLADVSKAMSLSAELDRMGTSLDNVVSFMAELKQKGVSLDQLADAINLHAQLEAIGTSATEIAGLIGKLEQENIDTPSFVLLFHDWDGAGLTAEQARLALNYKQQLEATGFDIEALPEIAAAAVKFGSPAQVLEAVSRYGSVGKLDEELQTKRKELDEQLQIRREELDSLGAQVESRSRELDTASKKLDGVQKQAADLRKALATYRRLEAIGFDEKALAELEKAGKKYGTPHKVLTAVNRFAGLSDIKVAAEDMKGKLKQEKANLEAMEAKHLHLKSTIEMCEDLLRRKFGLQAITLIRETAMKYGEPVEVLKAIEAYGKLTEIGKETDQAKTELAEIKGKVEVEKETYAEYNARNKAILDQFEALNAKAIEVGREVGVVQEQTRKDTKARDILNLLQNPTAAGYQDYATLVLLLARAMRIWVNENKNKFNLPYRIDEGLKALSDNLGGS
jgi:hypothetical protein